MRLSFYKIVLNVATRSTQLLVVCAMTVAALWGQSFAPCSSGSPNLCASAGAEVGVGTTNPGNTLDIESTSPYAGIIVGNTSQVTAEIFGTCGTYNCGNLLLNSAGTRKVLISADPGISSYINNGANVGIGTNSPAHLLHVAGTIGAEAIIVSTTGADYVFEPGYSLQPLSEVAEYVKQNRHLPGIPPASESKEKGVSLGEMQTKLLAKIEELTLHMIQAEERNAVMQQRVGELEKALAKVEK